MYCTDADLLRWEPALFVEAAFAAQTLLEAKALLTAQTLTLCGAGRFNTTRVRASHVVVVESQASAASLPICSIDSSTRATLDRLWMRSIWPAFPVTVRVSTFAAQRQIISDLLDRIATTNPIRQTRDPRLLRRACALGTLHMIYAALSAASRTRDADLIVRTELYAALYRRSLRALAVECDEGEEDDAVQFIATD